MPKEVDRRKPWMNVCIFVPEEDFETLKELKKLAKTDERLYNKKARANKNFVSLLTRKLWKDYIYKRRSTSSETN